MDIPIGVANSVSANFNFDPIDTLHFVKQSNFTILQIFLNKKVMEDGHLMQNICDELDQKQSAKIFFHAEGYLNRAWLESDYTTKLFRRLKEHNSRRFIIHYDENASLDEMLKIVKELAQENFTVYLENYFLGEGSSNAEKNMRKFMALFTLANSHGQALRLLPVLDVPRLFHQKLGFDVESSLNWCFQMLNYFDNRKIPILLHLIDARNPAQQRISYCPIGEGYIPYSRIFTFLERNHIAIAGIILEFEDKINALKSQENLLQMLP